MGKPRNVEETVVTADLVGRVYVDEVERAGYLSLSTGRFTPDPAKVYERWLICSVAPADPSYYRTCPDAGPRVECVVTKLRPGRPIPTVEEVLARPRHQHAKLWLPTTGNDRSVMIERLPK